MKTNLLAVLSDREVQSIHEASIEILATTGVAIESDDVRKLLVEKGASCDGVIVKFSKSLIEDCVAKNRRRIQLTDRNGKDLFLLGDGGVRFAGGHNAVFVMDSKNGERRNSTIRDVETFSVLCEHLEDIDLIGVPLNPSDAPPKTMLAHAVAAIMRNSRKPIFFSSESREVNLAIMELALALTGQKNFKERSYLISQLSTTSPLFWEKGAAEALVACAKAGLPVAFLPQPIAGLTAPYTLAGNITVHNTEVISGVVIAHLVNPGTPLIYAAAWTSYDMRHSNVVIGRPEEALMRIAGAQMARHYNMVSHSIGPDADSNLHDEQMGWEKMMSGMAAALSGNDLIVNAGMFGTGMTVTNEQLILDNEMNRFVKRIRKGIAVNESTVAKSLIMEKGARGSFIDTDHTLEHLRTGEHIEPTVIKALNYEDWRKEGMPDCATLASRKVESLLRLDNPSRLDDKAATANEEILRKWDTVYK